MLVFQCRIPVALLPLLLVGCTATATPAVIAPGPATPAPLAPAPQTPTSQPPTAVTPTVPPPAATGATVDLLFPAGTLTLLQQGLRTQAAVAEQDLSPAQLARLVLTIDGKTIPASQFRFTAVQWESDGSIRATVLLDGLHLAPGARLTVSLPNGRHLLATTIGAQATVVEVSVASTARSLLQDAMAKLGQSAGGISPEAVSLIATRLGNAMAASAADPLTNVLVTTAVDAIARAIARGVPPGDLAALQDLHPIATTGGGGGGSSGNRQLATTVVIQNGQPHSGTPQGGDGL